MPTPLPSPADPATDHCPNCGASFSLITPAPRFCPQCGQATALHAPPMRIRLREMWARDVLKPLNSLALLLLQPGRLTNEFIAGRRERYLLPRQLFLGSSIVFFMAVKLLPSLEPTPETHPSAAASAVREAASQVKLDDVLAEAASAAKADGNEEAASKIERLRGASSPSTASVVLDRDCAHLPQGSAPCTWFEQRLTKVAKHWEADPTRAGRDYLERWLSAAPYAVFLLMPAYAAIVMLCYGNRRRRFGDHVAFGLHLHSVWFIAALLATLLPETWPAGWLLPATWLHGLLAMRRVYGGRWGPTLLRALAIGLPYMIVLVVAGALMAIALAIA